MSAAASTLPQRIPTNLKAACFVPLSWFERCLDLEYTRLRCLGLIIAETLGARPAPRTFAEIPDQQFVDTFHVSKQWVVAALDFLHSAKFIRRVHSQAGVPMYALREEYVQEVKGAGRAKVPGRCPDCKTVGLFSTEFIPTPFLALRKLGGCVDSATYRVTMVVIRHTMRWSRERRALEVEPQELNLNDFTRLCDLENRQVIDALSAAVKAGIVGREQRPGKPSLFWVIPEGLEALGRRPFRVVTPSAGGVAKGAKESTSKTDETPTKPEKTSAEESRPYIYGRCDHCGHFVDVQPVTESEFADAQPKTPAVGQERPPRAGPTRETGRKLSKTEQVIERLRRKNA